MLGLSTERRTIMNKFQRFLDKISANNKFLSALKSSGLGPTRHTFRRVADEASKAESLMKPQRQKQRCPVL